MRKLAYYIHPESDCAFADIYPLPSTDGLVEFIGFVQAIQPCRQDFLKVALEAGVNDAESYSTSFDEDEKHMSTDTTPTHSRLSPSKAYQWTVCTASIPFIEKNAHRLPPEKTSTAADEGTKAHAAAEALLLGKPMPADANRDMKMYAKQYADFCREVMGPKPDLYDMGVEFRVPLFYLPSEKGTVDFWCWNKKGMHFVDFKYGYDPVSSIENKQMAIYAKSIINKLTEDEWLHGRRLGGDDVVTITIFQPRTPDALVTWNTTVAELEKFVYIEVELHAKDILAGKKGVFSPGDKTCKYCRAAAICEARSKWLLSDFEEVEELPEKEKMPAVKSMTEERILAFYKNRDQFYDFMKSIEAHVESKVLAGHNMPGLKVVLSKGGHRKWTDANAAAKLMMENGIPYDEVYETDIISPAKAEELVKHKNGKWLTKLYNLWFKPRGVPIVVPENDPRRAHKEDFTEEFLKEDSDLW